MGMGDLTLRMALIVAVGVFLASFTDAIAGGGGIISVPTYLLAGLPAHYALGTNKLSAGLGTIASTGRFIKNAMSTGSSACRRLCWRSSVRILEQNCS